MSKSLYGSVEQQITDSVSRFFRGFGYDNRTYDGYDHYDANFMVDGRPDTRQHSQNWDTGLRYSRDFSSHSWWRVTAAVKIRTMIEERALR